jgi:MFS family permease
MSTGSAGTASRYGLLAALYGSQFVPLAFFLFGLPAVLRTQGTSLELLGLLHLIGLVWVIKFLWAPLVDHFGSRRLGHYRGWLLITQALIIAAVLALIPLDPVGDLPIVILGIGVVGLLSATQDIATDATAVRLLEPAQRGVGNGIQKAGGYLGLMVGGGGGLLVYDRWGWPTALGFLAVLTALPIPVVLRYREAPETTGTRPRITTRILADFFRQPGAARWAFAVQPLYLSGIALASPLAAVMLVDAGWGLPQIGTLSIIGGGSVAIVAALVAGTTLSKVARRHALIGFGVGQIAAIAALLLLAGSLDEGLPGLIAVGLLSAASAATGTAVYTLNMDWCRAATAATDYTVQDSLVELCLQVTGAAALSLAGVFGYQAVLVLAVLLSLTGMAAVTVMFRAQPVTVA